MPLYETTSFTDCDLICGEVLADDPPGCSPAAADFPDDSDDSCIAGFVETESDYSPRLDYPDRFRSRSLDHLAREESISWILKVRSYYRFHPLTAYFSVNYMDRFLSYHRLPQSNGWPMQLLALACLSLAAKMEETQVPSLLDLQVEGIRFIFEPRTVTKMELLVLTALNWRLRSVTPFTYIDSFAFKADPTGALTDVLISRATRIILATTRDTKFFVHSPSSLAAAAIIYAADETMELPITDPASAVKWCIGLTEEGVTNCYQSMQGIATNDLGSEAPKILQQLRVTTTANMAPRSSPSYSFPLSKRRKLSSECSWVDDDKEGE